MQHNVHSLIQFIEDARSRGLNDEDIIDAAESINAWNASLILAAVNGVDLTRFANIADRDDETDDHIDDELDYYETDELEEYEFMDEDVDSIHEGTDADLYDFETVDGNIYDDYYIQDFLYETPEIEHTQSDQPDNIFNTTQHHKTAHSDHAAEPENNVTEEDSAEADSVEPEEDTEDDVVTVPTPVTAQSAVYGEQSHTQYRSEPNEQHHTTHRTHYAPQSSPYDTIEQKTKLPILQAVIHHVSLWVFLFCSIPAIIYLVSFLMDSGTASYSDLTTLTTFASVLLVSGGLYVVMYAIYIRKTLKDYPNLKTGKVFSILTIAGSTVGAVISGIVLLSTMMSSILLGNDTSSSAILSSLLITIIFSATILTYFATDFMNTATRGRKLFTRFAPAVTGLILLGMFALSFTAIPSVAADSATQRNLVETTDQIVLFTEEHGALPNIEEFQHVNTHDGITFENTGHDTYELCAVFERDTTDNDYAMRDLPIQDRHTVEWNFNTHSSGNHCFAMQSSYLLNHEPPYEPMPYPQPSVGPVEPAPEPYPQPRPTDSIPEPTPGPTYTTMPIEPELQS